MAGAYGGSVRRAPSDGRAHADLLTAAGCRRLMSCCHSASSSPFHDLPVTMFIRSFLFRVCKMCLPAVTEPPLTRAHRPPPTPSFGLLYLLDRSEAALTQVARFIWCHWKSSLIEGVFSTAMHVLKRCIEATLSPVSRCILMMTHSPNRRVTASRDTTLGVYKKDTARTLSNQCISSGFYIPCTVRHAL